MGDASDGSRPGGAHGAPGRTRDGEFDMGGSGTTAVGEATDPQQIGPYEIRRRLGAGAMGVVYEGWDPRLRRSVAVKMLLAEGAAGDRHMTRLIREAQALAQLRHANVVAVYDVGTHEGAVYVVMELVDGETLGQWAMRVRPNVSQALDVLSGIGRGLAAAHDRGLVHRDIKPDNVLVDRSGTPRIVDFGLARVAEADLLTSLVQYVPGAALDAKLTQTGTVLGTPVYMSPEQLQGSVADARSDQYAFGVTAYYLLYGVLPFAHDSIGALVHAVTTGDLRTPPDHGEPRAVRDAVFRALSKDPAARFPTMGKLVAALSTTAAAPAPRRRFSPWVLAALGAVGVVVIGGLGVGMGLMLGQTGEAAPSQLGSVTTPVPAAVQGPVLVPAAAPVPNAVPDAVPDAVPNAVPNAVPDAVPVPVPVPAPAPAPAPVPAPEVTGRQNAPVAPRQTMAPPSQDTAPPPPEHGPEATEPTPSRSAPLRELRIANSNNLWANTRIPLRAARHLIRPLSNCFDPHWQNPARARNIGITVTVTADGRATGVVVEDTSRVPMLTRVCIARVFESQLHRLPRTLGRGGEVVYVIPFPPR